MDKTPKERIVFDEGVYYGDEGSEISIEDITSREGITVEEVLEGYTEEEIFENAMNMMDIDRSEELAGLKAFLDGSDNPLSSYDNPLGGNRIIARGSIGRWDGTRHGMTAYRDFDDMISGPDSVFKDCEIGKVWDENGSLFIHGYHHDGGKEYDGSPESVDTAMRDLWEDPDLCPTPRYMELAFGCPAEEYEAPAIDPLLEAAEFTPSAIMSAEVAPGAVTATVHDVSGVPYEVPADVLNGLKDAVRISDRAATIEPSASLTIDGWNQKLDDSLWALDFEDRNGVPPQLSDWLARDAEGEKGNESAKTSPVSLKTAAEEAHAVSTMLSKKNGGTDEQDGKDDLQRHMIPSEMRIPSQNDHHRAPSLSDIAAETRAASAAMETNIASRIDRERDAR